MWVGVYAERAVSETFRRFGLLLVKRGRGLLLKRIGIGCCFDLIGHNQDDAEDDAEDAAAAAVIDATTVLQHSPSLRADHLRRNRSTAMRLR